MYFQDDNHVERHEPHVSGVRLRVLAVDHVLMEVEVLPQFALEQFGQAPHFLDTREVSVVHQNTHIRRISSLRAPCVCCSQRTPMLRLQRTDCISSTVRSALSHWPVQIHLPWNTPKQTKDKTTTMGIKRNEKKCVTEPHTLYNT